MQEDEIRRAVATLEHLLKDASTLASLDENLRVALMTAAGRLSRPQREDQRRRNRQIQRARRQLVALADKTTRKNSGIREARRQSVFNAPSQLTASPSIEGGASLHKARGCYVCKAEFTQMHFFYDSMCAPCAEFNYKKRFQTADLRGQTALITGARLKIGYQASLMLLRAGAKVIATTRFPHDAAERYAREADFAQWSHRLQIHGLDLRHTPSVELFARYIEQTEPRLDFLLNNAAQTVRRPPGFYAHLMAGEESVPSTAAQTLLQAHTNCIRQIAHKATSADNLPVNWQSPSTGIGLTHSAHLSQIPYSHDYALKPQEVFPQGHLDADLQQVDLREVNSWRLKLAHVPTHELLEVQLVNAIAPFVLCSRLATLMRRQKTGQKHIVNVTAMEGKFSRFTKTDKHPHTNMAKAALNMLTHTSARDLAEDGIFMNAVDTGWVTDEDPAALSLRKQKEHDFQPPLDIVDGAARICDPIFDGINSGQHWCGKFLKDYFPTDW